MSLRLRNTWKYKNADRWDWSVFVEDDGSGDLDDIAFVEYILHPTFPNPRKVKTDRENNFAINANGWGVFLIKAFVNTKKGEKIKLEHYLVLGLKPPEGKTE